MDAQSDVQFDGSRCEFLWPHFQDNYKIIFIGYMLQQRNTFYKARTTNEITTVLLDELNSNEIFLREAAVVGES